MSVPVTPPDSLDQSLDQGVKQQPDKKKEITGKSPMAIAASRLMRDKIAVVCALIVLFFVLVAIFAPLIAKAFGVNLEVGSPSQELDILTGFPKTGPPDHGFTWDHPFGLAPKTANDNLAYWLYGCRTSILVSGLSTLIATLIGVTAGLIAGYAGGIVDRFISFWIDFWLTIPFLLMALTLAPILNDRFSGNPDRYATVQLWALVVILSITGWMQIARLVRGEVLSLREREFILSAQVVGMPTRRILFKELLPNLAAPIVVSISLLLPVFVAAEAGLAYLGIGITQGASWGQTILKASPIKYFQDYPLFLWEPLIGIVLLVLALNLLGDAVRDALDPKTRR
jgi:ABC-type dipeptide/oligopeptide/nickel transport system permease subunit